MALLLLGLAAAPSQIHLHWPPGSNNRVDEGSGPVSNPQRLFDAQNDPFGGYGYGGDRHSPAATLKFMVGSELSLAFALAEGCGARGGDHRAECQVVLQGMCNPNANTPAGVPGNANGAGEGPVRDGTVATTPDPNNPDDYEGLHEPASFYAACAARERNRGLYTADQNVNNHQGAQATRQNPNGARSGQECPEERDYYPYWHPSPWKDVAIVTNHLALCQWYQEESQNVKAKGYCQGDDSANNAQDCQNGGGTWTEQAAFDLPPPECVAPTAERDGLWLFNWTVPSGWGVNGADDATNCVLRARYNVTPGDLRACEDKSLSTRAVCEAAGKVWSAQFLDSSYNSLVQGNNNTDPSTSSPPLLQQRPDTSMGGFLTGTGGTDSLLALAVDTRLVGRTFEDRSHVFEIQARPVAVSASTKIYNLGVLGKRGLAAEVHPALPYRWWPDDLVVGMNDLVHVHWTGNDQTFHTGEGMDGTDRHNLVQIADASMSSPLNQQVADQANLFDVAVEWNPEGTGTFSGARDRAALVKQFALAKQTDCDQNPSNDQDAHNCQVLNAAAATVDLGLLKFKPGEYHYLSTRNHRPGVLSQKGTLRVLSTPSVVPEAPVGVRANLIGDADVQVSWSTPGPAAPYVGYDGREYWGFEQLNTPVAQYSVTYSTDGGQEWVAGPAECALSPCTVAGLPRGTTVLFKVNAWGAAGQGAPSDRVAVRTADEPDSLGAGDVSAIVLGTLLLCALCTLCACVCVRLRRSRGFERM